MIGPITIVTPRLQGAPAGPGDTGVVQAVLEAAPTYLDLPEAPRGPRAAAELLAEAEADEARRVLLLRTRAGGAAAGLLDLQLHWPEPGAAHVRLLLLREALQGLGLGREVAAGVEVALRAGGFRVVRLSVTDENAGALSFWLQVGFAAVERLDDGVTVLEKRL